MCSGRSLFCMVYGGLEGFISSTQKILSLTLKDLQSPISGKTLLPALFEYLLIDQQIFLLWNPPFATSLLVWNMGYVGSKVSNSYSCSLWGVKEKKKKKKGRLIYFLYRAYSKRWILHYVHSKDSRLKLSDINRLMACYGIDFPSAFSGISLLLCSFNR